VRRLIEYLRGIDWGALVGSALVLVFLYGVFVPWGKHPLQGRGETWFWWVDSNGVTAVSTAVIAIFTVVLAVVTNRQARLTRESIELANREYISTHRPKLRIRFVVITNPVPPNLHPLPTIAVGQHIVGHLNIVNVGETVARIRQSHCIVFWTQESGLPMSPPYQRDNANGFAGNQVIQPAQSWEFNFRSAAAMGDDAAEYRILTRGYHLYVMGWVRYADDRDVVRQTKFCRLYGVSEGERHPRFHIVQDPDYESED
jgi:hypothetical protein